MRAQLDAWPPFAATTGEWSRERKSKPPEMTDVELEGGPLVALGLVLPVLVGAAAVDRSLFSVPGCEMTEVRKKRICTVPANAKGKAFLTSQLNEYLEMNDGDLATDGPINISLENHGTLAWFNHWPTTPSA